MKQNKTYYKELLVELSLLKNKFAEVGLYKSMHKIDEALNIAGFEVADKIVSEEGL